MRADLDVGEAMEKGYERVARGFLSLCFFLFSSFYFLCCLLLIDMRCYDKSVRFVRQWGGAGLRGRGTWVTYVGLVRGIRIESLLSPWASAWLGSGVMFMMGDTARGCASCCLAGLICYSSGDRIAAGDTSVVVGPRHVFICGD